MRDLIGFELRKICLRPVTLVALIGFLVVFIYLATMNTLITEEFVQVYDAATGEEQIIDRLEAVAMKRAWTARFAGTWTDETMRSLVTEYRAMLHDPANSTGELNEEAMYWRAQQQLFEGFSEAEVKAFEAKNPIYYYKPEFLFGEMNAWSPLDFLLTEFDGVPDDSLPTLREAFPGLTSEAVFGWHEGPLHTALGLTDRIGMFLALLLIVALSPLFAEERTLKTDALLLSARFGRDKLITAKMIAGMLFSLGALLLFFAADVLCNGLIYGFEGWGLPVQLADMTTMIPWSITFGGYVGYSLLSLAIAAVCFAALQMLLSTLAQSPIPAMLTGIACFLLSLMVYGMMPLNQRKFAALLPPMLFQPDVYLTSNEAFNWGFAAPSLPALAGAVALCCFAAFAVWGYQKSKRQMVA